MTARSILVAILLAHPISAIGLDHTEADALLAVKSADVPSQQFEFIPANVNDLTGNSDNDIDIQKILTDLPVSVAQANTQQTPLDNKDGVIYTANIEPGPDGDIDGLNLLTVVRRGILNENRNWLWEATVVEDRTLHDKWHTAPSIAIDRDGFVHVAYNMHNLPWQYKVSVAPNSIENFEFRGEKIKLKELERLHYANQVNITTLGKADIPGNLITYPAFFKDREQDLYVSYRFAARPKRPHAERAFSSGIAKYEIETRSWQSIGSDIEVTLKDRSRGLWAPPDPVAFASTQGWTSYRPYLVFDSSNRMHVNWYWRKGTSGSLLTRPCYLISENQADFYDVRGLPYLLPISAESCGNTVLSQSTEFYNIGNTAINSKDDVYIVYSPDGEKRGLLHFDNKISEWVVEESPYGATELFFDSNDNFWAISTGLKILRKKATEDFWTLLYANENGVDCLPRVSQNDDKTRAYIHTQRCKSQDSVSIYELKTD